MTDHSKTAIALVIDESGSMGCRRSDVIGGFNTLIADQRKLPGTCSVSLTKFAEKARVVFTDLELPSVRDLTDETYKPDGGTALLDAMGSTITQLGERLKALPENQRPAQVMVVVITDGEENASREHGTAAIREMIKHQTEKYGWIFNFMGCTLEAIKGAETLGISITNTIQFGGAKSSVAFANYSGKLGLTRGMVAKGADMHMVAANMSYSAQDREEVK